MNYLTFDKIYEKYSEEVKAKTSAGHKIGQVREKFTEIVEAVGTDINLFRTNCDVNGEPVIKNVNSQTSLKFPESSREFTLTILKNHGDKNYKELRRGNFDDVELKVLEFLLNGFTEFIKNLGYSQSVVLRENYKMQRQMRMAWHRSRDELVSQCAKLIVDAEEYNNTLITMNYDDKFVFMPYIANCLENLRNRIAFVHGTYTDIRGDELSDLAKVESDKKSDPKSMEKMYMELQLGYDLSNDEKYQRLVKKRDELLASYDFVKNKKTTFDIISKKISDIYERHRREIFGDIAEESELEMNLKSPYEVLAESISYVEECEEEDSKRDLREVSRTDEANAAIERAFEECIKKAEFEREIRLQERGARSKEYEKIFHS